MKLTGAGRSQLWANSVGEGKGKPLRLFSQEDYMTHNKRKKDNDVNGTTWEELDSVAFGRGGSKAYSVVNQRNPCKQQIMKKRINIGTWNIRTLRKKGKLCNVIREMRRAKIKILGLCEVRWPEPGEINTEGVKIIHTGANDGQGGLAMLLDGPAARSVKEIYRFENKILMVKLKAVPTDIVAIQVYMPTTAHEEEEVDAMYDQLENMLEEIKGTDYVILMGDWNAVVGEGGVDGCMGNYGLGKRNKRGQKLIDFCIRQQLVITNTCFQHHKRRRYTWKMPGNGKRYQLDYIMVRKRYRNSVKNSHALPGADADTDHNLVKMSAFLQLKSMRKRNTRKKLNRGDITLKSKEFAERIDEQLETGKRGGTVEEKWEGLKNLMTTTAEEVIGYGSSKEPRKPWITKEMIEKMEERRTWKHQTSDKARTEYRRLNNELRRETEKARNDWWSEQCTELEQLQRIGKHELVYDKVKKLTKMDKRRRGEGKVIKNKDGKILTESKEVLYRWKEYIEELYDKSGKPEELPIGPEETEGEDNGPDIIREEVEEAIKFLKNNKSEGIDNIPAEIIKNLGERATKELFHICQEIYNTGEWPKDFTKTIITPIEKKVNALECKDYRTLSLLCHASKIMLRILKKRIEGKVEAVNFLGEDQFGFRKGRGTRDAIGVLRVLGERSLEHGRDVYICFVDYEKAFDRICWKKLFNALERLGVDWKDRRLIRNLYMEQAAVIRIDGELSEPGIIGRGSRQGCPLSPLLFNIYIEELVREALENVNTGVKVGGRLIQAVRFADDQAMVADSLKGLQEMMNRLNETSEKYGMKINVGKTKVMSITKNDYPCPDLKMTINGQKIDTVKNFCYLGSVITEDGRCHAEVQRRIAMGKLAFNNRGELMRRGLNKDLKKRLVKTLIWSVVLYASETWTLRKEDIRRLEAFEMWVWRRMEKISWTEKKTNEEVLDLVQEERSLVNTIRQRQRNWIGHILRGESLLRTVLEGSFEGKRQRGRPRTMLLDWMMVNGTKKKYNELKDEAKHRASWRHGGPGPVNRQRT